MAVHQEGIHPCFDYYIQPALLCLAFGWAKVMITDKLPRKALYKKEYQRSDSMRKIELPPVEPLRTHARHLEEALSRASLADVKLASNGLASVFAAAFEIPAPPVRVLGARPQEVSENAEYELFGDYDFDTARIRLWMRTAVRRQPTSYGTLLSTLCHELCHHLDVAGLELPNTFHTRGFYERTALIYHHIRGTPLRPLVWTEQPDGTFRINWPETMRGRPR